MLRWLGTILSLCVFGAGFAQCPTADFNVNDACLQENISLENMSTGADKFYWDFCAEDMFASPTVENNVGSISEVKGTGITIVEEAGNYFGFIVGRGLERLYRLEYGQNLNQDPVVVDLGNIDDIFIRPEGVDLVKYNNEWLGLVGYENNNGYLTLLEFGTDLKSVPTVTNIGSPTTSRLRNLTIEVEDNDLILLYPDYAGGGITRVNYRDSFENNIDPSHIFETGQISDLNLPIGLGWIRECDNWYALVASYSVNKKIYLVDFGTSLVGTHSLVGEFTLTNQDLPRDIDLLREGDRVVALISNENIPLEMMYFNDLSGSAPVLVDNSGFPTNNVSAIRKWNGRKVLYGFKAQNLGKVDFYQPCQVTPEFSVEEHPTLSYYESGMYEIELTSSSLGLQTNSIISKPVTISSATAPELTITPSANQCLTKPIDFTHTADQNLVSYDWDFGDGVGSSTDPNPSYTYTNAGTYTVRLTVASDNGCEQFTEEEIMVYNEPQASFTVPGGLLCSNNPISFTNTTTFDPGSPITWSWDFGDGSPINTEQAPTYSYPQPGDYTVKLTVILPTCMSEFTVPVSIQEGPLTNFSFENMCNGNEVVFADLSSGTSPITTWLWDFGDGNGSSDPSPQYQYASPGDYQVTLTTTNQLGCSTFSTQTVTVHSIPLVAFTNESACARAEVVFTDNSSVDNANIDTWMWDFGDGTTSSEQNPSHVFSSEGSFEVKLKVISNYGCSDSLTVTTTVAPSASVAFSFDQACLGIPTQFINETTTDASNPITNTTWVIDGKIFTEDNPLYTFPQQGMYRVSLTVSTQNLCLVTYEEDIAVNPEPVPTFGYSQTCGNGPLTFYDTTVAFENDPIVSRTWQIDGEVFANDSVVQVTPDSTGLYKVSLIITTQNGCLVSTLENVDVLDVPRAGFATATSVGAFPLELEFVNTSIAGDSYAWLFDADTIQSTETNPVHTFANEGDYEVLLITSNTLGCADTTTQMISAVAPLYGNQLNTIVPVDDNGRTRFFLNVENTGTVTLDQSNMEIRVQLGPDVTFTEPFNASLYAYQSTDYPLAFQLESSQKTPYLCVELVPIGYEIPPSNSCLNFTSEAVFFNPYPNPTSDWVKVGIAIPSPQPIYLTWMDGNGKVFFNRKIVDTREGYNEISFEATTYMAGNYFLTIRYQEYSRTFKVVKR